MSAVWASPMIGPWGGSIVISALCWRFSTARITLVSNRSPRILRILLRPVSTSLRMVGVITYFLAVYSTFIRDAPVKNRFFNEDRVIGPLDHLSSNAFDSRWPDGPITR